jgi:hypothetical protein
MVVRKTNAGVGVGSSTFFRFRLSPTLNEASDEGAEAPFLEAKFLPSN